MADDGSYIKNNYRLVSKGFSQVHGVDYTNTFSPVAKMDSIRLVLAIVASKRWEAHHMDVKSAFLHGDFNRRYICRNLKFYKSILLLYLG